MVIWQQTTLTCPHWQRSFSLFWFWLLFCLLCLKGTVHPQQQKYLFFLTYSGVYPFRLFWCALHTRVLEVCRDVCLLSTIMELIGTRLVALKAQKNTFEKLSSDVSFQKSWHGYSRQSTGLAVSSLKLELFSSPRRGKCPSTHGWEARDRPGCKQWWPPLWAKLN